MRVTVRVRVRFRIRITGRVRVRVRVGVRVRVRAVLYCYCLFHLPRFGFTTVEKLSGQEAPSQRERWPVRLREAIVSDAIGGRPDALPCWLSCCFISRTAVVLWTVVVLYCLFPHLFLFPPAPHPHSHPAEKLLFVLVGWLGSFVLRQLLFRAGAQSLSAMLLSKEAYSSKPNELKCMSLEAGSEVSVPSALHRYRFAVLKLAPGNSIRNLSVTLAG
jgi:hypothetical protein